MAITVKTILRHVFIPVGFGLGVGLFSTIILNPEHFRSTDILLRQFGYSVILSFLFWKGSEFISVKINNKYSWLHQTKKTILILVSALFLYSLLVIFLFYLYIWFIVLHKQNMHNFFVSFRGGFYMCLTLTAIGTLLAFSHYFFKYWKQSVVKEEELKRESITLKYEALKNQVNPHFLFNSLNVLTSLIDFDKDASVKYVKQLSEVMRYVLDKQSTELVKLSTELKFIESFVYLLKIRFGDNFNLNVHINNPDFLIVPVALQILIENAVKHNEVSSDNPLYIEIDDDQEYLYIHNNIQPRNYLPDSNLIGLKSLSFQYEVLSDKHLDINNNGSRFTVKIPKIKQLA